MADRRLHRVFTAVAGNVEVVGLEGISSELRREDCGDGRINDGADEFKADGYNLA